MAQPRPFGQPLSPLVHYLLTLHAMWMGCMIACICLFFVGRAWVARDKGREGRPAAVELGQPTPAPHLPNAAEPPVELQKKSPTAAQELRRRADSELP